MSKKKPKRKEHNDLEEDERFRSEAEKIETFLSNQLHLSIAEIKPLIEAHITEKCSMRRSAERHFKIDIRNFFIYTAFLVVFCFSASSTDTQTIFNVRGMLSPFVENFNGIVYTGIRPGVLILNQYQYW